MSDVVLHEDEHVHHPFLQHHFEDLGQQHEASTLGMWLFLSTEILFFGGVLCAYWIYRTMYPQAWALGGQQQNTLAGGINTIVLIISSLTMALAVRAALFPGSFCFLGPFERGGFSEIAREGASATPNTSHGSSRIHSTPVSFEREPAAYHPRGQPIDPSGSACGHGRTPQVE